MKDITKYQGVIPHFMPAMTKKEKFQQKVSKH